MLGLGKKKDRDADKELTSEEVKNDLKDLKSKNKKNRKEPQKPWGKRERVTVLLFLFGTAATAGILGLSSRSWKLPNLPRIVTPELSLEGKYVLEATESDDSEFNFIKNNFKEMTRGLSGVYGMYVFRVNEQTSYGVFEDESFTDPETINLLRKLTTYERYERNEIRRGDIATDNPDVARVQELADELGMSNTLVSTNSTTPSDTGKMHLKLLEARIVNRTHTNEILEPLLIQNYIGTTDVTLMSFQDTQTMTQSGIFYLQKQPVVFVIMGKGVLLNEAESAFPRLLRMIYDFES